jgi:hypothetical protein
MWIVSWFDDGVRLVLPGLGKITRFENQPSREVLGIEYKPVKATLVDYGHSLIFHNLVKKTPGYKPPFEGWTPATSEKQ